MTCPTMVVHEAGLLLAGVDTAPQLVSAPSLETGRVPRAGKAAHHWRGHALRVLLDQP